MFLTRCGDLRDALESAERSLDVAQNIGNDHDIAVADWMMGYVHFFLGDQEKAQHFCELGF